MRNFERQADLYAAETMKSPGPIISSLEKIGFLSGNTRDLPSWHHFSIRQRVECLAKFSKSPNLLTRHNHFLMYALVCYLVLCAGAVYFFNFSEFMDRQRQIVGYEAIGNAAYGMKHYSKAIEAYEKVLKLDPDHAEVLNNLAWLLLTTPGFSTENKVYALELARRAAKIKRKAHILDTLAEAYYVNGMIPKAIDTIKDAIDIATENQTYYQAQLEKFRGKR